MSIENTCTLGSKLTIDEAIEHAKEIGSRDESSCSKQHMQLASWLQELKDLKLQHLYLAADFDNYKKRVANEKDSIAFEAKTKIMQDVLRIVDDMERLKKSISNFDSSKYDENTYSYESVCNGFSMIYENLVKLLESKGCKRIEVSCGDRYDWKLHDAAFTRLVADDERYDPGDVCEILQSGWTIDGKLLRPAKVVVAKTVETTNQAIAPEADCMSPA